jgi:hypothetical protein
MMSESLIIKLKKLCYLILDLKILTEKRIRVGPYATNTQLILVDLVDDEEVEEVLQRLTMRSKETGKLVHSS